MNDLGVKWWRLDWPALFFLTEFPWGERKWVALHDGQVVYETDYQRRQGDKHRYGRCY